MFPTNWVVVCVNLWMIWTVFLFSYLKNLNGFTFFLQKNLFWDLLDCLISSSSILFASVQPRNIRYTSNFCIPVSYIFLICRILLSVQKRKVMDTFTYSAGRWEKREPEKKSMGGTYVQLQSMEESLASGPHSHVKVSLVTLMVCNSTSMRYGPVQLLNSNNCNSINCKR